MTFWIAATAFIATNVDDLFLLTLWFVKRSRFSTILIGQLIGFASILLLSITGYFGLRLLPSSALHWVGLAPIVIGVKQLVFSMDYSSKAPADSTASVAAITFANGSDNLAVYAPLFGRLSLGQVGLIVILFYLFLIFYVFTAFFLASRLKRSDQVHKWAHRLAPLVIIGIGVVILLSH